MRVHTLLYKIRISLEMHKKLSVWVDFSVGSNHFKPVLTSILKQPHTETMLPQHQQ